MSFNLLYYFLDKHFVTSLFHFSFSKGAWQWDCARLLLCHLLLPARPGLEELLLQLPPVGVGLAGDDVAVLAGPGDARHLHDDGLPLGASHVPLGVGLGAALGVLVGAELGGLGRGQRVMRQLSFILPPSIPINLALLDLVYLTHGESDIWCNRSIELGGNSVCSDKPGCQWRCR